MARLFFAIWPDAEAARALALLSRELAQAAGGKVVCVSKIHLTLAFLGEADARRLEAARSAAAEVQSACFDLTLDCVGSFPGPKVAWAGSRAPGAPVLELHSQLAARLRGREFVLESRPFTPHVTLARGIGRAVAPASIEPIQWRARELTLMESQPGTGRYQAQGRWVLSGFPPAQG